MKRVCGALTKAGRPCRARAIPASNPPLCAAHTEQKEAEQPGCAPRQGYLFVSETPDIQGIEKDNLDAEIDVSRLIVHRLMQQLRQGEAPLSIQAPLLIRATGNVATIMLKNKQMRGRGGASWEERMGQVLDRLGEDWEDGL